MKKAKWFSGIFFALMALAVACGGPASTSVPVPTDTSPIVFVMQDNYALGQDISIKIKNNGTIKYAYSTYYPACNNLIFHDESLKVRMIESFGEIKELAPGEFIIPKGTHCDLAGDTELLPGEDAELIIWDQQECIKDNWGCAESIPLQSGSYSIIGSFEGRPDSYDPNAHPYTPGDRTTIEWSFTIGP